MLISVLMSERARSSGLSDPNLSPGASLYYLCEHCIEFSLRKRTRFLTYLCLLEMVDGIDDRTGIEAAEESLIELVEPLYVYLSKLTAIAVALALLWDDVVVVIAPDEKSHAEVGGHEHFLHGINPPGWLRS